MIPTVSAMASISPRMWLETITVISYSSLIRFSRSRTCLMPAGSRPLVGSSRISSLGKPSRAAARPSRCFMPRE